MPDRKVLIEGSGKHCHLSRETLDKLFGEGFELEVKKALSQPGEFLTPHKIGIAGPKGETQVSIIGPCRAMDQVELSLTDARALGLDCPVRESGELEGSASCTLSGPAGTADIPVGAIIAKRHVHLTPEDAEKFGLKNRQIIKLKVGGERALIFDEVVARVSPNYATAAHIDYDEMNAAGISGSEVYGEIVE